MTILGLVADGVWKGVYPWVFGHSKKLSQNKFFDPSTPSMRKGRDGGEKNGEGKTRKNKKRLMITVATTSLPAVDRPNPDRWSAAFSCQNISLKALVAIARKHATMHQLQNTK